MTERLHLCAVCASEWCKCGEIRCTGCSAAAPARKPIPLPGSLPSYPSDLGITE